MALLKKELERNITPPLDARVDVVHSQGAAVIRVTVPNGPAKPYALSQSRIFVRQEAETSEAVRDEIVQMVLSRRQAVTVAEPPVPEVRAPEPVQFASVPPPAVPEAERPAAAPEPVSIEQPLPAIGVEIIAADERKGGRYFTIRDLRNGNVVQNVTLASARKLWSYAINQYLTNPVDPVRVTWSGDLGLWQAGRRAKKLRYDLVLRRPDGSLRVFYGVTADGMTGPWAQFLQAEDKVEGEGEVKAEVAAAAEAPLVFQVQPEEPAKAPAAEEAWAGAVAAAEPEVRAEVPAQVVQEAEPVAKPRSRSRRRKTRVESKPEAVVQTKAEMGAETEVLAVTEVTAEAPVEGPAKVSDQAEGQVEGPTKVIDQVAGQMEGPAEAVGQTEGQVEAETAVKAQAVAESKPKSRSRRRKPKTKSLPEVTSSVEAAVEALSGSAPDDRVSPQPEAETTAPGVPAELIAEPTASAMPDAEAASEARPTKGRSRSSKSHGVAS
jgi:hypothetical protein